MSGRCQGSAPDWEHHALSHAGQLALLTNIYCGFSPNHVSGPPGGTAQGRGAWGPCPPVLTSVATGFLGLGGGGEAESAPAGIPPPGGGGGGRAPCPQLQGPLCTGPGCLPGWGTQRAPVCPSRGSPLPCRQKRRWPRWRWQTRSEMALPPWALMACPGCGAEAGPAQQPWSPQPRAPRPGAPPARRLQPPSSSGTCPGHGWPGVSKP